jgi:thiol-disulfide isomerase/thioredoxin
MFSVCHSAYGKEKLAFTNITVIIEGQSDSLKDGDSVVLKCFKYGLHNSGNDFCITQSSTVINNRYSFKITGILHPVTTLVSYFRKGRSIGNVPGEYFTEPGDSINILDKGDSIEPYNQIFTGKGAAKYTCQNYLIIQGNTFSKEYPHYTKVDQARVYGLDSLCKQELRYLTTYKEKISKYAYSNLEVSAIAYCECSKYQGHNLVRSISNFPFENEKFQRKLNQLISDTSTGIVFSGKIYFYVTQKYRYDSLTNQHRIIDFKARYLYIKQHYQGIVREQLICQLLSENAKDLNYCIEDALNYIFEPSFKKMLQTVKSKIGIGQIAYNFSLRDTNSQSHNLSNYRDSVVVLDFWFTGCTNCRQLAPFMDSIEKCYMGKNVKFVTISIDVDSSVWKRSLIDGKYTSSLSTNLFTNGLGENTVIIERYNVKAHGYPTIILIDKQGRMAETPIDPRLDKGSDLKDLINKLM